MNIQATVLLMIIFKGFEIFIGIFALRE